MSIEQDETMIVCCVLWMNGNLETIGEMNIGFRFPYYFMNCNIALHHHPSCQNFLILFFFHHPEYAIEDGAPCHFTSARMRYYPSLLYKVNKSGIEQGPRVERK